MRSFGCATLRAAPFSGSRGAYAPPRETFALCKSKAYSPEAKRSFLPLLASKNCALLQDDERGRCEICAKFFSASSRPQDEEGKPLQGERIQTYVTRAGATPDTVLRDGCEPKITCRSGRQCPAAPSLPSARATRRRPWRCGSSCRHSRAAARPRRCLRRR